MEGKLTEALERLNAWYEDVLEYHYLNDGHPKFLYGGKIYDMCYISEVLDGNEIGNQGFERNIVNIDGNNITLEIIVYGVKFDDGRKFEERKYSMFGHIRWMDEKAGKDLPNIYRLEKIFSVDDLTQLIEFDILNLMRDHTGEFIFVAEDLLVLSASE